MTFKPLIVPPTWSGATPKLVSSLSELATAFADPTVTNIDIAPGTYSGGLLVPNGTKFKNVYCSSGTARFRVNSLSAWAGDIGLNTYALGFRNLIFENSYQTTGNQLVQTIFKSGYSAGLGNYLTDQATSVAQLPTKISFHNCVAKGNPTSNVADAWLANMSQVLFENCSALDVQRTGDESHGWLTANTDGKQTYRGCTTNSTGIGYLFGGSAPIIPGCQTSDITMLNCSTIKRPAHRGVYQCKNSLEFKTGRRVYVDGFRAENNWTYVAGIGGQDGTAFLMTPRYGQAVDTVFMTNLVGVNIDGGFLITAADNSDIGGTIKPGSVTIDGFEFLNVGYSDATASGNIAKLAAVDSRKLPLVELLNGRWNHAGTLADRAVIQFEGVTGQTCVSALNVKDCAGTYGRYGFVGTGTTAGDPTLAAWATSADIAGNWFATRTGGSYSASYNARTTLNTYWTM